MADDAKGEKGKKKQELSKAKIITRL